MTFCCLQNSNLKLQLSCCFFEEAFMIIFTWIQLQQILSLYILRVDTVQYEVVLPSIISNEFSGSWRISSCLTKWIAIFLCFWSCVVHIAESYQDVLCNSGFGAGMAEPCKIKANSSPCGTSCLKQFPKWVSKL